MTVASNSGYAPRSGFLRRLLEKALIKNFRRGVLAGSRRVS